MKSKKLIIYFLFILILIPFIVNAEVCSENDIKIEQIELNEIIGNAEEVLESNSENNQINLNAKMNVIGDSLTYKVTIKNTSNSDYVFDKNQITKDYIHYDISYEDDSNMIKAGDEKVIYLRLNYQEKPRIENLSNGVFSSNNQVSFNLINESGEIINPKTKNKIIVALIILVLSIGLSNLVIKKNHQWKVIIGIISLLIIPQIVNAICTSTLDINLNLEIDAKEATFLPGTEVNIKMKQLAGDDTSTATNGYNFEDQNITTIKYSEIEPKSNNKEEKNIVSIPDSEYPIYMWYENGTIYWWSEDQTPSLNEDASYMFSNITLLEDITDLTSFDLSSSSRLNYLFNMCKLSNINSLVKWNTSNITDLTGMLAYNYTIVDVSGLENWNVSNVISMNYLFMCCYGLEEIDLSNWKTDSLTNMEAMFSMAYNNNHPVSLKRIILSEKFDSSKVTSLGLSFYHLTSIEDYSFLRYLDTSNVTDLHHTFYHNSNLLSLEYLKDWDVSSVKNMWSTFSFDDGLYNIDGLKNWNVSNVTNFNNMFYGVSSLEVASAINDWNIQRTATFDQMFRNTPSHPEFTKVEGTWNAQGTFSPN